LAFTAGTEEIGGRGLRNERVTDQRPRIEEINVILQVDGLGNRKVATIRLGRSDASIYVFPYSNGRTYFYGSSAMAEKQTKSNFGFTDQESTFDKPHLSIHESGAVQVTVNRGTRAGPLQITPLTQAPVGHLATVRVDTIEGLREHNRPLRNEGKKVDWPVVVPADVASCRLVLRLRGDGERAPVGSAYVFLQSPRLAKPLALCLEVVEDSPTGGAGKDGVTVIAGWNPVLTPPAALPAIDFLYLRAQ
jgi:hypothetical protein